MRGFKQKPDSNNSEESFLNKSIEDYTIKDCEDFLAKYPKDIDADKVREHNKYLTKRVNGVVEELPKSKSSATSATLSDGLSPTTHTSEKLISSSYTNYKLRILIWRIIFAIACLIIGILFIICIYDSDIKIFYSYGGHFLWNRFAGAGLGAIFLLGWLGNKADFD